jgi:fructokinase
MRIGVDLGGTKIEALALGENGDERGRRRIPAPRDDYAATLAAIAGLVDALDPGGIASVGVGIPGAISPKTGFIKNANSTWLIGHPLDRDLGERLGRPVRVANDANCFAISEATDGAAAGAHCVFGAILGTGVGGGIAIDGRVLTGANAIAGEWGHTPLPWPDADEWPGPDCDCGRHGCIETFVSGTGLARDFRIVTGRALAGPDIVAAAAGGDAAAEAALARYENRLARALTVLINILDPDVIVLGGGMSNLARLYDALPALSAEFAFSNGIATPIVAPRHGDASGVRGAAWLWPDEAETP